MAHLMCDVFPRGHGSPGGLLVVIFTLLHLATTTYSTRMHNVHWNASNPLFLSNNLIEINRGNHPWEYDQVNIVCPVYKPGTSEAQQEKYIIYSVSKEEYESCRITQPNPKIIAVCNRPYDLMYFTITFRSFTPTPGGLEFYPGHDYYFISTSSRSDLHRRVGGGCSTNNMRIVFRVAQDSQTNSVNVASNQQSQPSRGLPPSLDPWKPRQLQDSSQYQMQQQAGSNDDDANYNSGSLYRRQSRVEDHAAGRGKNALSDASTMPFSSSAAPHRTAIWMALAAFFMATFI